MTEEAQVEVAKVRIRPDTSKMVAAKSPSGGRSFHANDEIGNALAGLTLESVKTIAEQNGIDTATYKHLNAGQQRMNIGGRLRKLVKDAPETIVGIQAAAAALLDTQAPVERKKKSKKVVEASNDE